MNYCYGKGVQNYVLCWEVVPFLYRRFHCINTYQGLCISPCKYPRETGIGLFSHMMSSDVQSLVESALLQVLCGQLGGGVCVPQFVPRHR